MSGFPKNSASINSDVATLGTDIRNAMDKARRQKAFFDQYSQQEMLDQFSLSGTDYTYLKGRVNAWEKLARVTDGQDTVPVADDFLFELERLTGTN